MPKAKIVVYCADPGSVTEENFGWARQPLDKSCKLTTGSDLNKLCSQIADDIGKGRSIALGFECVLFIPLRETPATLTLARIGEGNRAWSASSGATSTPTGLVQATFLLRSLRDQYFGDCFTASTTFSDFDTPDNNCRLLLWEAFVSGDNKRGGHQADASAAVTAFIARYPEICVSSDCAGPRVLSLIGAIILRTGWSSNLDLLSRPCIFVRP